MKYKWLLLAIMVLALACLLGTGHFLAWLVTIFWLGRLLSFKNKKVLSLALLLSALLVFRYNFIKNESSLSTDLDQAQGLGLPTTTRLDGDKLTFEAYLPDYQEKVMVHHLFASQAEKESFQIDAIQSFTIQGKLEQAQPNTNINQFNYQSYLARQGIFYIFKAEKLQPIPDPGGRLPLFLYLDRARQKVLQGLEKVFTGPVLPYIQTLVFGHQKAMARDQVNLFKELGIIHIISISGLHVDLLVQILSQILSFFRVSRDRSLIFLIFVLPLFSLLAGLGTSVFRAVVSNLLYFIFRLKGVNLAKSDAWSITLILALLLNPLVIFGIGFQLSYGISGLLLLIEERQLLKTYKPVNQLLVLNLLVNMFVILFVSYHYFEFPLISYFLNIIFVPIFSLVIFPMVLVTLFLGLVLHQTGFGAWIMAYTNFVLESMEDLLSWVHNYGSFTITPGRLSWPVYLGLAVIFYLVLVYLQAKKKKIWALLGLATLFILGLSSQQFSPLGQVYVFDVGQGDAILVKPPMSASGIMIDTGGQFKWQEKEDWQKRERDFSLARDEIIPTLKSMGISHLEALYLTHGDYDHVGETQALLDHFPVSEIRVSQTTYQSDIIQAFARAGIDFKLVEAGQVYRHHSLTLAVLHPKELTEDSNDASLVLYGKLGGEGWLFTGDIEAGGEEAIMASYPNLQIDNLKLAHHGSKTSSGQAFIDHYRPKRAYISAGRLNPYGHPHSEVLDRLEGVGTQVFRTDQAGGLIYTYSDLECLIQLVKKYDQVIKEEGRKTDENWRPTQKN